MCCHKLLQKRKKKLTGNIYIIIQLFANFFNVISELGNFIS